MNVVIYPCGRNPPQFVADSLEISNVLCLISAQMEAQLQNKHLSEQQRIKFRVWLQKQFTDRCQKNPRYSLRAFSATLGIEASTVSQFLSGKRAPSAKSLALICQKLSATPKDLRLLGTLATNSTGADEFYQLSVDTFSVLADWYHFAILELTYMHGFKEDPKWIASELGITVTEARTAYERLCRLNLLVKKNGKIQKTHEAITNHAEINTSAARKSLQRQIITKALKAVDETPQEEKDITSMTMAIDPNNLDRAREMIKNFRRELCAVLEEGNQVQVYNLGIQLYPISRRIK